MGTVNIVFSSVGGNSGAMPAYNGIPVASENVTSSGTSAQSTNSASSRGLAVRVTPTVDIYVKIGANPTAAAGDWYVPAYMAMDFMVEPGDKVAVIDA